MSETIARDAPNDMPADKSCVFAVRQRRPARMPESGESNAPAVRNSSSCASIFASLGVAFELLARGVLRSSLSKEYF